MKSPYQLNQNNAADQFYSDLWNITNKTLDKGYQLVGEYVEWATDSHQTLGPFAIQRNELVMELLMLGVFWRQYSPFLSKCAKWFLPVSNLLYSLRKKYIRLKAPIDHIRGVLSYLVLSRKANQYILVNNRLNYLITWLEATHEFEHEVNQLKKWEVLLQKMDATEQEPFWNNCLHFSNWFAAQSDLVLGKYTENYQLFIQENQPIFQYREDYFFSTRSELEYHLNMVFAQVMNNTLKPAFEKTVQKVVLLPTCMSLPHNKCQAKYLDGDLVCSHCSSQCQINQIDSDLQKRGQSVVLIPHTSGFTKFLKKWENNSDTGLVGVACTLNLIQGGYAMKNLHIPSQCVFLNHCGCKKHWLSGETTSIDQKQLNRILEYGYIE